MNEDGGISPGGRFQRMEDSLERIESKLDHKADRDDVQRLELRIVSLESGTTPLGMLLIKQFEKLQRDMERIDAQGSHQAQEADALARKVEAEVIKLSSRQAEKLAVHDAEREGALRRHNGWMLLVSITAGASAVVSVLSALGAL
jgi:hypothetical protein